jgi:hypothetical protein
MRQTHDLAAMPQHLVSAFSHLAIPGVKKSIIEPLELTLEFRLRLSCKLHADAAIYGFRCSLYRPGFKLTRRPVFVTVSLFFV